nr:retrovirus-related Pol polyprotein [Tanacetum cinerariifolium]
MRTRSQSRHNSPQQETSPVIVEPLRIEFLFLEEQFEEEPPKDPPEVQMTDNRTMAEMLRAPTKGYAEAIIVPPILAEQFELKHSLINMMTSEQFFGLEKDNPHDHIRWFNKITSTIKYRDVPNSSIKLMLFPFSLAGAACRWLEKEPPPQVKAVEETCVTCGGAHPYYQCLAAGGKTFPEFRDNIQEYVSAAAANYNQGSGSLPSNTIANPKGELKAITTRSGIVIDGPTVPTPPTSINPEVDERVEETFTDPDLAEYTIKVPPPPNRVICTPTGIARDVFVPVGKFTFPADFVIVDYESDPRLPLILGRPFLRYACALIDVHDEEMILRDGDERLTLNMKHDTASYSNHPQRESANLINSFNVSSEHFLEVSVSNQQSGNPALSLYQEFTSPEVTHKIHDSEGCNFLSEILPDIDAFNDIHPYFDDDPLSGSTTYSANSLLEEFTNELALITYPPNYDDNLQFDIESDLKEIEFLLYQGEDSSFKDSSIQTDLANLDDYFIDPIPEMFTKEHAPDYSSPLKFDVYLDDILENESNADNFYNDLFDSEVEKIKESKLLMDELNLPCDSLLYSEFDSFKSQDFSKVDNLPSPDNEDKVFNLGILIHEKSVTIITRVAQEKKLAISYASLVFKDFKPPFYAPRCFKDVPKSRMLLPFSTKIKEKVFKPGVHTSGKDYPDCEVSRFVIYKNFTSSASIRNPEVLGFSDTASSGNPTPLYDLIVSATSPTLTPFGEKGDILLLEALLNDDPSSPPQNQRNSFPEISKELKICEAKTEKSSVDEPLVVELKALPSYLEYAFLEGDNKLPIIIAKDLSVEEKAALITVLKSHKRAIAWKLSDIKGINPEFCSHKILLEEDFTPAIQHQRRVNPKIHDVIKQEDQEKTTFTCPYRTFAYRRMPFGLYNAPRTFQRCMMAIFHDMIEKTMEVFMDDFSVFGDSFQSCLSHLEKM